jgi:hypothetical protein
MKHKEASSEPPQLEKRNIGSTNDEHDCSKETSVHECENEEYSKKEKT